MNDQILLSVALSFLNINYKWGGRNPLEGVDCSQLCQCILESVGLDPPGDQTAQGLFDHFSKNGSWNAYGCGALAFYGKDVTRITHVGFCLDQYRMVEAAGGGSKTLTLNDAISQNAYVKVSLIKRRNDLVAVIKPFYRPIAAI